MKPYGNRHEPSRVRANPDKADIAELGLPSRFGGQKAAKRRAARRRLNKASRRGGKREASAS